MRRLFVILLVLVLLVVAAVVALPFVVPAESYKGQITAAVKSATGRDLTIAGPLRLSVWPYLGVAAEQVSFSNAPGAKEDSMATMERLSVAVELIPLLSGQVKVRELVLIKPVINLETDKAGKGNWDFGSGGGEAVANGGAMPVSVPDLTLSDGQLTFRDGKTGTVHKLDDVDVTIFAPSSAVVSLGGSLIYNGERVTLTGQLENPAAFSAGEPSQLGMALGGPMLNLSFSGTVNAPAANVQGEIDIKASSARRLVKWLTGTELAAQGFGPMAAKGNIAVADSVVNLSGATLALDGMSGTGDLSLSLRGAKPKVGGVLALDRLDLNPYLGGGGGSASGGWSDATIDLAGLNAADADLDLTLQGLSGAGLTLDRSRVGLAISGGRLTLTVREANLYGGQGQGTVSTAAAGGIAANMRFNGVAVEPLLKDAVGYGSLTGSGNLTLNVKGQGRSQRAWMQSLGGNAALDIRDGALKGVDLAAVSRSVQGALAGGATGGSAKTDFAELTGSFVLRDGVAANNDLKMLNPFLRVTGKGLINLGQRTTDYRIEPKAVASIEGQGGKSDLGGVMVPFRITGPWSNLSYTPDLSGAIGGGFEDLLKGGGGAGKGGLDGLIPGLGGGDKDKAPEDKKDAPKKEKKPEDALKGLVPGF